MSSHWNLGHVGMIVKDIDATIEFYDALGFKAEGAPKDILLNQGEVRVNGKPNSTPIRLKICNLSRGNFTLELVEPVSGDFILMESLIAKGDSVDHFAFFVEDLEDEKAEMKRKGFAEVFGGADFAFFDTRKIGNVTIELQAIH